MHMVHFNSKYGNLSNALKYSDGLAVLSVLLEVRLIFYQICIQIQMDLAIVIAII